MQLAPAVSCTLLLIELIVCKHDFRYHMVTQTYGHVQFLAFSVFTGYPPPNSLSNNLNMSTDIEQRLILLREAIEQAYGSCDTAKRTLKLFMAPEFFFRTLHGPYTVQPLTAVGLGWQLQDLVRNSKFEDWLFVFGSVHAYEPQTQGHAASVFNFAPIIKGENRWLAFKRYVSQVDFGDVEDFRQVHLPCEYDATFYLARRPCVYDRTLQWVQRHFGFDAYAPVNHTLAFDGIRIGIELCYDHERGSLASSLPSGQSVDVQLIISAGMNIERGPVSVPREGNVFSVDGNGYSEVNRNWFGHGHLGLLPTTRSGASMVAYPQYDVGPVIRTRAWTPVRYPLLAKIPALRFNWSSTLSGLFVPLSIPRIDVYTAFSLAPAREIVPLTVPLIDGHGGWAFNRVRRR
jgi:predicted amidohydrolase